MRLTAYAVLMDLRINDLLTALSEPTRLRALQIIWDGAEHCVCEPMDRLGATQSPLSRHMARPTVAGPPTARPHTPRARHSPHPQLTPHPHPHLPPTPSPTPPPPP